MTNTEFKKKIAEAKDPEWFKNISVTFNFSYINVNLKIDGLSAIYEYINQQIEGWEKVDIKLPIELENSKAYFNQLKKSIIHFVNNYHNQVDRNLSSYWSNVQNLVSITNSFPLPHNSPEAEFLLRIHKESPRYFQGAFTFLIGNNFAIHNKDSFFGALLAYEFSQKDSSEIVERRNAEKSSISKIRNDFQKYLSESDNIIVDHIQKTNDKYKDSIKEIDDLKADKDAQFTKWFDEIKKEKWQKWYDPTTEKIKELEDTYREKLKLEEPAKYWSERAGKLEKQGWIALSLIIVLVGITCWSLAEILWSVPAQIYESWFGNDKSAAIRWSIIYITLISFIAYAIRSLTKFMFSSFHLARDCEERHTLTYFYLSLLKDSKVDEKDRQLIMQSLFSRAETGLLKDDSSPTMPSDAIGKIISRQ
jgi:hypothetical protein